MLLKTNSGSILRTLIGGKASVRQNVNVYMSGCRVNMFVMPVQVLYCFSGASYSFEML